MGAFFGPSETDLERLRATVQSLGTTSVPGLAAALSWRERKAEKLLAHELGRPGTPLVYEPGRRTVRWGPVPPPSPGPTAGPAPDRPGSPTVPGMIVRTDRAPSSSRTAPALTTLCTACHVPLIPTGSSSLAVCPQCGRLANPRTASAAAAVVTSRPAAPAPRPEAPKAATSAPRAPDPLALADRRSQELFAAYVTSRPIPCPKCRTPLRHKGVSEYSCPSCGQSVRFPSASAPPLAAP